MADLSLMGSQIADVACNACIWDERRAESDPLLPVTLQRSGRSRISLNGPIADG